MPVRSRRSRLHDDNREHVVAMHQPDPSSVTSAIYDTLQGPDAAELADVTLLSSDGEELPAVRFLLALRSPFFDKLFFSDFAENKSKEVHVQVGTRSLREILQFAYTDDSSLVQRMRESLKHYRGRAQSQTTCDDMRALVELAVAADYCSMEKLREWCEVTLEETMERCPRVACATLGALRALPGAEWCDDVASLALRVIWGRPREALLVTGASGAASCKGSCGVLHLSFATVDEVFRKRTDRCCAEWVFRALNVWVRGAHERQEARRGYEGSEESSEDGEEGADGDEGKGGAAKKEDGSDEQEASRRRELGKKLAKRLYLAGMEATFLRDFVETSGLVDRDQLFEAYKYLALHPRAHNWD